MISVASWRPETRHALQIAYYVIERVQISGIVVQEKCKSIEHSNSNRLTVFLEKTHVSMLLGP